ncbi:MAG TPA: CDP-glucose 4,6-dehydratase [Ramlibacter sp.]|jgi:CDP-glucose 4,6-dehydratase|nr:CDP-glucose 4,6-dehydratase [Ramlibacter sp.]
MFDGAYAGRRVLLTGHTGFKGSWLALWLRQLGAEVTGLALAPDTGPNHWDLLDLRLRSELGDTRQRERVQAVVREARPEVVFHLAAQALVRPSYDDPLGTWGTNVMGTAHVLDACRQADSVRAIVVVTSDKCYENNETGQAYREDDRLGGHDPYSASKAATELVAASYRRSFFAGGDGPLLATARAGNVVGGGDWSRDRLVPDLVRGVQAREPASIRHPEATRPWQHVLEPLAGYLLLGQKLLQRQQQACGAWNFGPNPEGNVTVGTVLEGLRRHWPALAWQVKADASRHEATLLHVDSGKARAQLGWSPTWDIEQTLEATAHWYASYLQGGQVRSVEQLQRFVEAAARAGSAWARP